MPAARRSTPRYGRTSTDVADAFDRGGYSSVLVRAESVATRDQLVSRIEAEQRLKLEAKPELKYYEEQTERQRADQRAGHFCRDHNRDRRVLRRNEHDVRGCGLSDARDRNAAGVGFFEGEHHVQLCHRVDDHLR